MKALLLPILLALAGLGAGVGAGLFLAPHEEEHAIEASQDGEHGDAPEEAAAPAVSKADEAALDEIEFARLSNQFIVPVIEKESVAALVVLSITLEVRSGGSEAVFQNEPRLRDRFLRVMFDHANIGGFDAGFTQTGTMSLLRNGLLETARETLGPLVQDVLIVDIIRQEV